MEKEKIYDLIYCSEKEGKELIDEYPSAKITNASDEVHEERFSIELISTRKNYLKNVVKTGYAEASLTCQLAMQTKEDHPMMDEIIKELKEEGILK